VSLPLSSIQNRQNHVAALFSRDSLNNLDDLHDVASGASFEIVQLQGGSMHATFVHAELGRSSVHSNALNLSVRGRGPVSNERWTINFFPQHVAGIFNSSILEPSKILIYRPGAEFDGTTGKAFQDWTFTVDDVALRRVVQQIYRMDLPDFGNTYTVVRPNPHVLATIRAFASKVLALHSHKRILTPRAVEALEAQLLDYSSKILMSGVSLDNESSRATITHARLVRESEQYLTAHQDDTVSVPQLCVVADVSERTLRNAFQTVLGISPNAYIKARRLRRARLRLCQSSFETTTVTEIAMSSGFWHLGNFSRDYFEFFGERPSETLKASNAP
jgi:AraC family ethanolamine operon transcriptional activator